MVQLHAGHRFDLADPQDVDATLTSKLEDVVGPPQRGKGLGFEAQSYDPAALADLQSEEVAMVAADVACEEQHITAVEEEVRAEYEAAYREQHASLMAKVPAP